MVKRKVRSAARASGSSAKSRHALEHWGSISFIVGVVIALALGLAAGLSVSLSATAQTWLTSVLVILGLVVGFLNIAHHEAHSFVYVSTALVLVIWAAGEIKKGDISSVVYIGKTLSGVLDSLVTFIVPAVLVASLRAIYGVAKHYK